MSYIRRRVAVAEVKGLFGRLEVLGPESLKDSSGFCGSHADIDMTS